MLKVLLATTCLFLACCSKNSNERQTSEVRDTIQQEFSAAGNDAVEVAEDDSLNFNDQDYGDPGLNGLIVSTDDLDNSVKNFITRFSKSQVESISLKEVLVIEPGPGVYPFYKFVERSTDITSIKEINLLVSDTTSHISEMTFYRWHSSRCDIDESFPDGVYFSEYEFDSINLPNEDSSDQNKRLIAFQSHLKNRKGKEFVIKFTDSIGESHIVDIYTYEESENLYIAIIDQRDCGA